VQASVVLGLLAAPVLLSNGKRLGIPVNADILTGNESSTAFVDRAVNAAPTLAAATAMLPPDTPVGYFGKWEGAQIYTEARLTYFGNPLGTSTENYSAELAQLGANPDEVLASLDRLGIRYFIWERAPGKPEQWRTSILSTEFLRHHTRILAGGRNSYLFEVLPNADQSWTSSGQNLLQSPGLDDVGDGAPWTTRKRVKHRAGVVSVRAQRGIGQRVATSGGSPYVLLSTMTCDEPDDRANLAFRWFDEHDTEIELTTEDVVPGTAWGEQFLWHIAPENASSVAVELLTNAGAHCDFDSAELYSPP
jgi:hypothetical protein